ncbi:MAG: relaxase/mobilization nuclease [Chitinophagaceae bacterium]|nr:MAG: relaxase/mobilization nuclease [Chitinophagaceae bacterium]
MVAKIKSGRSLIGALNYNEVKVLNGKAELISANGYFKDMEDLNFNDKLLRLTDLAQRNDRTKVNAVHISLNFAIKENLEAPLLNQIVDDYMQLIGFSAQPYLTYQHSDAGHPHVHIVTTNIQPSGERISLNLLGKTKSSEARKAIETKYGLVKAGGETGQEQKQNGNLSKVIYGKTESKRAITNVVNEVVRSYKFTSVSELNAVLNQFNIAADRGAKHSRMYEKNGLVYWITDDKGNKLGVPIKASSIYGKPTLNYLEGRFRLNDVLRKPIKEQIKNTIDGIFLKPVSKSEFQKQLYDAGIHAILRHSNEGRLYGVTFVDHRSKAVFNGSDLGKEYSANMLVVRFTKETSIDNSKWNKNSAPNGKMSSEQPSVNPNTSDNNNSLIDALFKEENQDLAAISRLQQRKRKKKRKGQSL